MTNGLALLGRQNRRTLRWRTALAAAASLLAAAVVMASEPDLRSCSWGESILAEFDVEHRRQVGERIPALAAVPEIAGEAIFDENGEPAGLEGPLHVVLMKCVRYDQLPVYRPFVPGYVAPELVYGVVVIETEDRDSWIYADVSFDGLAMH